MPESFHSLNPADLGGKQVYDILVAAVQPRPIAFISTLSADGKPNLAPFSFFMIGGATPPSVLYSPTLNSAGEKKNSLLNVEATAEFVVNAATREMAEGMNAFTMDYPDRFNEWEMCGFTKIESEAVKPARVAESPVQLECKLFEIVSHGSGPGAARYVIGEVVRIHIGADIWNGYSIDVEKFKPISRMGAAMYLDTALLEFFSLS